MRWVLRYAVRGIDLVTYVSLVALLGVTFAQVIARYFFRSPISWAVEFVQLCFVAIVFLGVVKLAATRTLIRVDILSPRLARRGRIMLSIFVLSLTAVIAFVVALQAYHLMIARSGMTSTLIRYPIPILYAGVLIGVGGIGWAALAQLIGLLRKVITGDIAQYYEHLTEATPPSVEGMVEPLNDG